MRPGGTTLTDVQVDTSALTAELDPHAVAINLDAINDRNYILLRSARTAACR
jgi:hypothetical protein